MASVGCVAGSRSAQEPQPNQLVARLNIEHQSIWGASHAHQMEILQVNEQITPITTIKRHRAAGRVRHRPRSLTTAGVEVRSSSRTSTSTRNPRPTPGHPHSTRKSHIIHFLYLSTMRLIFSSEYLNTVYNELCIFIDMSLTTTGLLIEDPIFIDCGLLNTTFRSPSFL